MDPYDASSFLVIVILLIAQYKDNSTVFVSLSSARVLVVVLCSLERTTRCLMLLIFLLRGEGRIQKGRGEKGETAVIFPSSSIITVLANYHTAS